MLRRFLLSVIGLAATTAVALGSMTVTNGNYSFSGPFTLSGLTGYLYCNGSSACTAATTVPVGSIGSLGTGVATALGVNVGSAGSVVTNGGALGTPSGGSAANLTSIPMANASGTLAVANGGTGDTGTAWATYTPTVNCSAGTLTTYTATGRYKTVGKTGFLEIAVSVTTNGTCAGYWQISMPGGWAAQAAVAYSGMDFNALKALVAGSNASASSVISTLYDGSYAGVSGHSYVISGVVEIQ